MQEIQVRGSRKWQPAPVFLPGKFHGEKSLMGYSPWFAKSRTGLSDRAHTEYFPRLFACGMGQYFIPFDSRIIFHCMDTGVHISGWAFWVVSTFGAIMSNTAMNIHSYPSFCVDICFHFS